MTLAKSLTAVPRGDGYFSAANVALAISAINSAIARSQYYFTSIAKIFNFHKLPINHHYFKIYNPWHKHNNLFRKSKTPIKSITQY